MTEHAKKYLVCGPPEGQLERVFKKFSEVQEKSGPFSAAFILGGPVHLDADLTALFDVVKSEFIAPFPVYFVAGDRKVGLLEDSLIEELTQRNIHFNRSFGIGKLPDGLRYSFVGGTEHIERGNNSDSVPLRREDLEFVEEQFMSSADDGLDLAFSWSWPANISEHSKISIPVECRNVQNSVPLAETLARLQPRYIFVPSHSPSAFYEREPFENVDRGSGELLYVTRFIALADAFNENGKKWIYAVNLTPSKFMTIAELAKRPDNCTMNPLVTATAAMKASAADKNIIENQNFFFQVPGGGVKRGLPENVSTSMTMKKPPPGYVCKKCHSSAHYYRDCLYKESHLDPSKESTYVCHICHQPGHHIRNCPQKGEQNRDKTPSAAVTPETCWFCLSNPAIRKYLIVDIGEEVYVTLAKGPITPEHLLLIPIEHLPSNAVDSLIPAALADEMEAYKNKIVKIFESQNLSPIFFKLAHQPNHHLHVQVVPIPSNRLAEFTGFLTEFSSKLGYSFAEKREDDNSSYFEFEFYEPEGAKKSLRHYFDQKAFFPAQYGRQVLAAFLNVDEKADWKNSASYTETEEREFVAQMKSKFKSQN